MQIYKRYGFSFAPPYDDGRFIIFLHFIFDPALSIVPNNINIPICFYNRHLVFFLQTPIIFKKNDTDEKEIERKISQDFHLLAPDVVVAKGGGAVIVFESGS